MVFITMREFIAANRDELIRRCRAKVVARLAPPIPEDDGDRGVPLFLDQLVVELGHGSPNTRDIGAGAAVQGRRLFFRGLTISQLVHDYGDICQSITDLSVELKAPIAADDFRTLNRCLDDAIASAVSAYALQQRIVTDDQAQWKSLELKSLIFTATTAFEILQSGNVGVAGTTAALVRQSLHAMEALV